MQRRRRNLPFGGDWVAQEDRGGNDADGLLLAEEREYVVKRLCPCH